MFEDFFDETSKTIEERVEIAQNEGSLRMQLKIIKLINKMLRENKKIEPANLLVEISKLK